MRNQFSYLILFLAALFLALNCAPLPRSLEQGRESSFETTAYLDSTGCPQPAKTLPDSLPNAPAITIFNRKTAEYFVTPTGVNVPSDVVVMENGDILIAASRANAILKLTRKGVLSTYASIMVYSIDTDAKGNLYGYLFPNGQIFRIKPNGKSQIIASLAQTACESTMAVAPDGTIYVGLNECGGNTSNSGIFRIPVGGGKPQAIINVSKGIMIQALDVDSNSQLYAMIDQVLKKVDTDSGNLQTIATLPEWGSFHGLVAANNGEFYYSTGDFENSGNLYRVDAKSQSQKLASFANNGLEGLALTKQGEVVGVQRAIGGVQLVKPDGRAEELIKPNGLVTPQSLAFSPCGDLYIVNDESGQMTVASADGLARPFVKMISFQPPQTYITFAPDGSLIAGESAPGFPSKVNRYSLNGSVSTITSQIPCVSGVAAGADDSILVSATESGRIIQVFKTGESKIFAEGLKSPQCLAMGRNGTLYVVTGGLGFGEVFSVPMVGDTIQSIASGGKPVTLAKIQNTAQIAIGPDGLLYAAAGREVYRVYANKKVEKVASGFQSARGLAFDKHGNLFVADENENSIILIRAKYLSK
jgi:sugar lactone lactonase YvrE